MNLKNLGLILILISLLVGCEQSLFAQSDGFKEPEPTKWVEYMKPAREYLYYRTQSVVENDIDILWERYPNLADGINRETGVNTEKFEVETLNGGFNILDANFDIESYERIKVKEVTEQEAVVLVHGGIGYIREDFDESGGEILIKLFVEKVNGTWDVVKTDEYTLPEYKEWVENN